MTRKAELGQFVEDEITPTPIQSAYAKMLTEKISEVLETLPPREGAYPAPAFWPGERPQLYAGRSGAEIRTDS